MFYTEVSLSFLRLKVTVKTMHTFIQSLLLRNVIKWKGSGFGSICWTVFFSLLNECNSKFNLPSHRQNFSTALGLFSPYYKVGTFLIELHSKYFCHNTDLHLFSVGLNTKHMVHIYGLYIFYGKINS